MSILEKIYYEWSNNSGRNEELEPTMKEMDKIMDIGMKSGRIAKTDFNKLDDLIGEYASISEKQGFMAGFEIAKQLFLGGKM